MSWPYFKVPPAIRIFPNGSWLIPEQNRSSGIIIAACEPVTGSSNPALNGPKAFEAWAAEPDTYSILPVLSIAQCTARLKVFGPGAQEPRDAAAAICCRPLFVVFSRLAK